MEELANYYPNSKDMLVVYNEMCHELFCTNGVGFIEGLTFVGKAMLEKNPEKLLEEAKRRRDAKKEIKNHD